MRELAWYNVKDEKYCIHVGYSTSSLEIIDGL
jgi:hypothetical protein